MRLVRFGTLENEKPGILDINGEVRDLSEVIDDVDGNNISPESLDKLRNIDVMSLPLAPKNSRIGACVGQVGKLVCIGLNYVDHAREANRDIPKEPVIFMKATSSISGAYDEVRIPEGCEKVDWEVELGIVIGSKAKRVSESDALEYVAGYCLVDDISERHFQSERGGQWTKGKCLDTFGPVGPWLVTKDEIPNPQTLNIWQDVDDKKFQDGNTSDMIFSAQFIVSYVSQFMTLMPGDIIATGTPAGVGLGQKPSPIYLKVGQTLRLGIEGLGEQSHLCVSD